MQPQREQSQESKFQNWHQVALGISTTTHGMVDCLKDTLTHLHCSIKQGPCAGLEKCSDSCSKRTGSLSQWCPTCTEWRNQIMRHHRYSLQEDKIQWNKFDSSEWPERVNEMVKVYGPVWWMGKPLYTSDLAVAICILHNCCAFSIPPEVCQAVRGLRKGYFAQGRLQVNTLEKDMALKTLMQLLESPDVSKTRSGTKALNLTIHFTKIPNTTVR
ncbi:uncharacterized protein LOC110451803 [Mizuhopecten yessoensis]|uniref:Uncharacterized protein n=1 Tax=Mizuhopecten yessoensis TaxID=6573 RepID=A0A210QL66_MIZYE|nr:uncharacterized protein LOC110451803 [Mizuhopecten yessoensis]OWF49456.1 hypothetical protein KP79_PYT07940 [Mizuhopecten yessoensis]